jgi:tetratricopeptide (TPR) repeat protein
MYRLGLVLDGPEATRKWAEVQSRLAREIGGRAFTGRGAEVEGDILYRLGDFARSIDVLRQGVAPLDPKTMRGVIPELRWKLSRSLLALGDLAGARQEAELARSETGPDDIYSQGTTRAALAAVRAAEGKDAEAERLYREAIEHLQDHVSGDGNPVRVALARFLIERGRGDEARSDLERLRDFYSDPAAARPRAEIEALLEQTVAVRS